jgi:hypothetical protein
MAKGKALQEMVLSVFCREYLKMKRKISFQSALNHHQV